MSSMAAAAIAIVLASSPAMAAPAAKRAAASNEPFRSFQLIDRQLSSLNASVTELTRGNLDPGQRTRATRTAGLAVTAIQRRSRALAARYRARRQRFGYIIFMKLNRRAAAVRQALAVAAKHGAGGASAPELESLSRTNLELVREFQRVSANYGAAHCARRQWACCEPKHDPDEERGSPNSCRWVCTATPQRCRGILGPQTLR